jgi:hypothetical protein
LASVIEQALTQMRADESCASRDQHALLKMHAEGPPCTLLYTRRVEPEIARLVGGLAYFPRGFRDAKS